MNTFNAMAGMSVEQLLAPAARTATPSVASSGVDVSAYEGLAAVIFNCALGTGTTPTCDAKLIESDDNTTFTDVPSGAYTQVTGAAGAGIQKIVTNLGDRKKYLAISPVIAGTTPSFTCSGSLIGKKKYA